MRKRTKIVATLGPSTDDAETLGAMMEKGLDLARLNFSHGDQEQQKERLLRLREVAEKNGRVVGVIGDLQGPKIRIRRFENSSVKLRIGDCFFIDSSLGESEGNEAGVGVAYEDLHKDVAAGDVLLLTKPLGSGLVTTALKQQRAAASGTGERAGTSRHELWDRDG